MPLLTRLALCLLLPLSALAAQSPVHVLQKTADSLITQLNQKRAFWRNNPQHLQRMVKRVVLPVVDLTAMSQQVLGRRHWRQANVRERARFESLFSDLVIQTYTAAMTSANRPQIRFQNPRGGIQGSFARITSIVSADDHPPVRVTYLMTQRNQHWKITDFNVDGISLVNSYQAQFSRVLNHQGLPTLLHQLSARGTRT